MSKPDREVWFRAVLVGLLRDARNQVRALEALIGDLPEPEPAKKKCRQVSGKHEWASSRALQCNCGFVLRSDR